MSSSSHEMNARDGAARTHYGRCALRLAGQPLDAMRRRREEVEMIFRASASRSPSTARRMTVTTRAPSGRFRST